jgi:hypothetical protein
MEEPIAEGSRLGESQCACPILSKFLFTWKDALDDHDQQVLKPFFSRLANSRVNEEAEIARRRLIADWYFRVYSATWLQMAGITDHASDARKNGIKANWDRAKSEAEGFAWRVGGICDGNPDYIPAWDAAEAAADSAAGGAAYLAAWGAGGDAAVDAAWNGPEILAGCAASTTSWYTIRLAARLTPIRKRDANVKKLQKSARKLVKKCFKLK